ncbi:tRNA dihydrouridine synthase DusB [Candidatus Saganbacteria bacterium]|nr:tRNA dihydrouridine synthase DusB [Candidatus Saganbacteria bacterium]
MHIGSSEISTNIFLAPLAGVADLSFRLIAREAGAKFAFFEMIDCNSMIHAGKDKDILQLHSEDLPIAAQLLGADPDDMLAAAKILLQKVSPTFLDINSACPVRKVVGKGSGAQLMREPVRLWAIIEKLASNLDLPITVKLRVGFKQIDLEDLARIAQGCEERGAAALFVHGRTRDQLYHGQVNYEAIKTVKDSVNIPVFGSGDIFSAELAKKMLVETGCDGALVARGALGNPWIFKEIEHYLATGERLPEPTLEEKKTVLLRHLSYIQQYRHSRPTSKMGLMRKHALCYVKKIPYSAKFRQNITGLKDPSSLIKKIIEIFDGVQEK